MTRKGVWVLYQTIQSHVESSNLCSPLSWLHRGRAGRIGGRVEQLHRPQTVPTPDSVHSGSDLSHCYYLIQSSIRFLIQTWDSDSVDPSCQHCRVQTSYRSNCCWLDSGQSEGFGRGVTSSSFFISEQRNQCKDNTIPPAMPWQSWQPWTPGNHSPSSTSIISV